MLCTVAAAQHSAAHERQGRQTQKHAPAMAPALFVDPEPSESAEVSVVAAPVVVAVLLLLQQELRHGKTGQGVR